ncbi:S10 family peptidase [Lunatimonas salinarum]|uniref:S10 family peptidase n=1 Tax=Lunatimonas salinarum TaxID=1774590 RepID=UPI001ADFE354|nr:carboxypeptidase [Lunatimonas salinarum]
MYHRTSKFIYQTIFHLLLVFGCVTTVHAQRNILPADTSLVSSSEVIVNGKRIPYQVTVGTQPVYGKDGEIDAALFYTYYKRSDVDQVDNRPIAFSFNGGPGAASVWMHLGYTSPKRLEISDEGYPIQPYGIVDNPHSIIDVADLVFVDPVNTGFSRLLNDGKREDFFGVYQDITYLADWIDNFLSRHGRWRSPKFLIGESYAATRVAGLSGELQDNHGIYLNGVIIVSGTKMELPIASNEVLQLPNYAAVAWYHKKLPDDLQKKTLTEVLSEVETYAIEKYLPAVERGGFIGEDQKQEVAEKLARYTGLKKEFILDHNLTVPTGAFRKELLRDEGYFVGLSDARYKGIDKMDAGDAFTGSTPPEAAAWDNAFTPAINAYLRDDLNFKTDLQYLVSGPVFPWPWDRFTDGTGEKLRNAMMQNPKLEVLFQAGYYDMLVNYFRQMNGMWKLDPSGKMKDRFHFKVYESGHMMYVREEDLVSSTNDLREFIQQSVPMKGEEAKY